MAHKILREIRQLIRKRKRENLESEKVFHMECPRCGLSPVTKSTVKEWYRLHDKHNKKTLKERLFKLFSSS